MNNVLRSFGIVVGVPTLIAIIYFTFIASDMFVSETRFAIRSSKSGGGGTGLVSLLSSSVISAGGQDAKVVVDFIQSPDMLATLEQNLGLVQHFSDDGIDKLSRLGGEPSREELLDHFLKHIELIQESSNDIIVLKVKAYTREYAQRVAESIIALSENLVNDLSSRIENDTLERAKSEVTLAAEKVRLANDKLTRFRALHTSINPAEETSALLGLISGLEIKLTTAKTELSEKRAFMKESSPAVKTLKNKMQAIERQLAKERTRVVGNDGEGMNEIINGYQPLALDQELAQQQYASALASLELSRIEAQRKKRYLVSYIKPVLPDESTEPRRLIKVLTVFIYSFLFFAIGGLMWSSLRDHIGH